MGKITQAWPGLPRDAWQDTYATVHMWTQIVGKVRKTLTPLVNHWWNVTLYVTPRGLTTSAIPYGIGCVDMDFAFLQLRLVIRSGDGATRAIELKPRTVADFYREVRREL